MDRRAGGPLLPTLRRRARADRALPLEVRPEGRRSSRARQHPDHRPGRSHRRAGAGRRPALGRREVAADRLLRRIRIRWVLGRRAETGRLGRDRHSWCVTDAGLSLDQRGRRRVPRRGASLGSHHRGSRGDDRGRARRSPHPGRADRSRRREPGPLRVHRERPERGGRTHRDGRGDGVEEAEGDCRARQDAGEDRRPEGAERGREVGVGDDGPEPSGVPRVRHRRRDAGQESRRRDADAQLPARRLRRCGQGRRDRRARPGTRQDGRVLRVLGPLQEGRAHRGARGEGAAGERRALPGQGERRVRSARALPRRSEVRRAGVRVARVARGQSRRGRPDRRLQVERDVQLPRDGHGVARHDARVGDGVLRARDPDARRHGWRAASTTPTASSS